jgi:hypothetical protein
MRFGAPAAQSGEIRKRFNAHHWTLNQRFQGTLPVLLLSAMRFEVNGEAAGVLIPHRSLRVAGAGRFVSGRSRDPLGRSRI